MTSTPEPRPFAGMGFREFVAIIAGLMAINALGIDTMLPALPAIGHALGITVENERQYIIAAYVFGFGAAQIFYGPLADRYGRKPILIVSLSLYIVTSLASTLAIDLRTIIAARLLQGIAAAATRVLAVSIVRDCFEGRRMARVMSLAFIVFLAVPILAPSLGQLVLLVGPWQWIFYLLALFALGLLLWTGIRLPETLHREFRRAIDARSIATAFGEVLADRVSLGYTLASSCMFGALLGYINSVQQIFADTFHRPEIFTLVFAGSGGAMGLASWLNSRVVERLGTRRVSHGALLMFIVIAVTHLMIAASGNESVAVFAIGMAAALACFALAGSNFGAMAMEPVGHIAGTAAAVQGGISSVGGALLGLATSQRFDGTVVPMLEGLVGLGTAALAIVLFVERGRLFRPQRQAAAIA